MVFMFSGQNVIVVVIVFVLPIIFYYRCMALDLILNDIVHRVLKAHGKNATSFKVRISKLFYCFPSVFGRRFPFAVRANSTVVRPVAFAIFVFSKFCAEKSSHLQIPVLPSKWLRPLSEFYSKKNAFFVPDCARSFPVQECNALPCCHLFAFVKANNFLFNFRIQVFFF